ncbi:MAG: sulfite exporter TauE/SafE family protein [Burkholderiales bacterium]
MMGWLETIALAAFMAGLMGGVHCAAMCGGIVCMLNGRQDGKAKGVTRWKLALAYNAGRILSYTFAGVLAGSAGQAGLLMRGSMPVQQVFMFAAGLTLCVMALYLAGWSSLMRGIEAAGALLWRQVAPVAQRMLPVDSAPKALGLGLIWGWLPCGMVYAALLLALSTGHPLQGGLVMLAFGLGTLPNMLLMSSLARRLQMALKIRGARLVIAGVIAAGGIYGILHAAQPDAAAADGFFCNVAPGWFGR